eukprot:GHVS01037323.1.p1 GENE.GHVS01037323.1~~GHVS01037323.1.p1  ORF type:complete len:390 (+),score=58.03 GHVS01037323.1:305-1474(+)
MCLGRSFCLYFSLSRSLSLSLSRSSFLFQEAVVVHDEFLDRTVVYDKARTSRHTECQGSSHCRHCGTPGGRTSIQCLDWADFHLHQPDGLILRKPWKLSNAQSYSETDNSNTAGIETPLQPGTACEESGVEEKEVVVVEQGACLLGDTTLYTEEVYVDAFCNRHTVPTLSEVLDKFHSTLKFNIELKGNNKQLGSKVLQICSEYSDTPVLRISTFSWIPPPPKCCVEESCGCEDVNKNPNGKKQFDLLEPIVDNELHIPLALLFNGEGPRLPSADRMVECLNKYKADWAHVRYNCQLPDDVSTSSTCDSDDWRTTPTSSVECTEAGEGVREVVEHLMSRQKKVMAFWGQKGEDQEADLCRWIRAGVAAICPNDPKLAMDILEREDSRGL